MSRNDQREHETQRLDDQPPQQGRDDDNDQGDDRTDAAVMVRMDSRFVCLSRAQFIALCAEQ